jgi:hypothetical protein
MKFLLTYTRAAGIIVAVIAALWASSALALENAYRFAYVSNQGVRASIETSNPTLRGTGTWSYMRPLVQRIINGNVYYAEIGHYKDSGGQKVYWTYRTTQGSVSSGILSGANPGVGTSYNYQVQRRTTNTWDLYFNSLSTPQVTIWVGWDTADTWGCGGETPDTNQGMGSANNNNVAYRNPTSGAWIAASTNSNYITNSIYKIDNGASSSSWRVYGNN